MTKERERLTVMLVDGRIVRCQGFGAQEHLFRLAQTTLRTFIDRLEFVPVMKRGTHLR